jgi:hypothetical protein
MFPKSLTAAVFIHSALAGLLVTPAHAQETETIPTPNGTAADLLITPRFSADFNTPRNGDGGLSFSRVSAFFPLLQTPGNALTFLSTSARLDTAGNLGGNVSLGHRWALEDLIVGGYVAYDIRDTGRHTFNQIGLGAELLAKDWTVHVNGYIPVGTTRAQVAGTANPNQLLNAFFQGNQLYLVTGSLQEFESALGGVDLDAGLKLASLGDYGTLWGYGGAYYRNNTLGGSLRLDHRINNNFRLGLGVQSDGIFGTRLFFSVAASLGAAPAGSAEVEDLLWTQAAEEINRNSSIVVQKEMSGSVYQTLVAVNPTTGQPYSFRHVNPNAGTPNQGDGSVINPFTTLGTSVADGANTALRNVNTGELVYVQAGDSRTNTLPPFTIPSGVEVYSNAMAQSIATQLGNVTLPGSGTGVLPLVNGGGANGITLIGGNNLVSGFEVTNSLVGIFANNSVNSVIQNNTVNNSTQSGIGSTGSTGSFIQNNIVDGTGGFYGIAVQNQTGVTIRSNQVSNTSTRLAGGVAGMPPAAIALGNVTGTALVTDNTVTGTQVSLNAANQPLEGVGIALANTTGNVNLTVSNNTVTGNQGDGIALGLLATAQGSFTITGNASQNNGGGAGPTLRGDGIKIAGEGNSQINALLIAGNTLSDNFDEGIDISLGLGDPGITISNALMVNAIIRDNTIVNNNGQHGIDLRSLGTNSRMTIVVQNNTLTGNTLTGFRATVDDLQNDATSTRLCLTLNNNNSNNGYQLTEIDGLFELVQNNNTGAPFNQTGGINPGFTGGICP